MAEKRSEHKINLKCLFILKEYKANGSKKLNITVSTKGAIILAYRVNIVSISKPLSNGSAKDSQGRKSINNITNNIEIVKHSIVIVIAA